MPSVEADKELPAGVVRLDGLLSGVDVFFVLAQGAQQADAGQGGGSAVERQLVVDRVGHVVSVYIDISGLSGVEHRGSQQVVSHAGGSNQQGERQADAEEEFLMSAHTEVG